MARTRQPEDNAGADQIADRRQSEQDPAAAEQHTAEQKPMMDPAEMSSDPQADAMRDPMSAEQHVRDAEMRQETGIAAPAPNVETSQDLGTMFDATVLRMAKELPEDQHGAFMPHAARMRAMLVEESANRRAAADAAARKQATGMTVDQLRTRQPQAAPIDQIMANSPRT